MDIDDKEFLHGVQVKDKFKFLEECFNFKFDLASKLKEFGITDFSNLYYFMQIGIEYDKEGHVFYDDNGNQMLFTETPPKEFFDTEKGEYIDNSGNVAIIGIRTGTVVLLQIQNDCVILEQVEAQISLDGDECFVDRGVINNYFDW